MNNTIEVPVFEPKPDDRIRILIEFNNEYKAIFWIKVAKDGSIYLGPRLVDSKRILKGKSKEIDGKVSVNFEDGQEVEDIEQHGKGKFSFHASGIINSIDERSYTESLRGIKEQRYLCSILFQWLLRRISFFFNLDISTLSNRSISNNS